MSDDTTLEERARGMLLGLACCDALGTTNEFLPREEALRIAGIVGGGPFELDAGKWTDDTSMALCLADALLDTGRYDSEAVMNAYADWRFRGRRSSTGKCFDIGAQVAAAIDGFLESRGGAHLSERTAHGLRRQRLHHAPRAGHHRWLRLAQTGRHRENGARVRS